MRNIHFKTCTCLLGILLMLFSGIQARGASLEVQQERKISGTVIDEKGEPVIGASVVVVETKQGTITNIDGKFQVNAPQNGRLREKYPVYLFPIRLWPIRTVREVSRFVVYLRVMPGWAR